MTTLTRATVEARLRDFDVRRAVADTSRASAVALVLFARGGSAVATVLTKRATSLSAYPGQWALPGGRIDVDETAEQAAVRELHEELGLKLGADSVLGCLDDFVSRSGYRITPVVVWSDADPSMMRANPDEVASVHVITLDELDIDIELVDDAELSTPVLRLPFRDRFIHAPTGAFLHQFREVVLHDRPTRVHAYSSPRWIDGSATRPHSAPTPPRTTDAQPNLLAAADRDPDHPSPDGLHRPGGAGGSGQ